MGDPALIYGTVHNAGYGPADISGTIEDGVFPCDISGTVSRALVDAWDSPSLYFLPVIEIDGEIVPDDEIDGPVIASTPIDGVISTCGFTLRGKRWGVFATTKTWTLTTVRVWLQHGPEGGVIEPVEPDFAGWISTCEQSGSYEPVVHVTCGDAAQQFLRVEACFEAAPGAGYTDQELIVNLCDEAGMTITTPEGVPYSKALQAANKPLFQVLQGMLERRGWALRAKTDYTFEAWQPQIKQPPFPPDFTWTTDDLDGQPQIRPPEPAASKYVLTANGVKSIDEVGFETETTHTEVKALTHPKVAVSQQQTDGSITATGFTDDPDALITVSIIDDTQVKKAGKLISQRTQEYALKNLAHARLRSIGASGGTAGGGFSYITVYIDEDGNYVQWDRERLIGVLDRQLTNTYDSGTLVASRELTSQWHRDTEGVRSVDSDPLATTVLNAYVYADDQSYSTDIEVFGEVSDVAAAFSYDDDGRLLQTQQDTQRTFTPRCRASDPIPPGDHYYVLYDGSAQYDLVGIKQLTDSTTETNILSRDGNLKGTVKVTYGFSAPVKHDGAYDWGGFRSDAQIQTFQETKVESKALNVIDENSYEEVTYPPEGGREVRIVYGKLPTTRYMASAWTNFVAQPIEAQFTDSTALAWWGFFLESFSHDYVQNTDEAMLVIRNKRAWAMAKTVEFPRCDTLADVGDTVRLVLPEHDIDSRFLIVEKQRDWTKIQPRATYVLKELSEWVSLSSAA